MSPLEKSVVFIQFNKQMPHSRSPEMPDGTYEKLLEFEKLLENSAPKLTEQPGLCIFLKGNYVALNTKFNFPNISTFVCFEKTLSFCCKNYMP